MPALREHPEDLSDLGGHFLARVAAREGRPVKAFTPEAMAMLMEYAWPGNVRELQNICERAAVLTAGPTIEASLVEPWLRSSSAFVGAIELNGTARSGNGVAGSAAATGVTESKPNGSAVPRIVCDGHLKLGDIERETIVATLEHHHGHRQRSARALGIGVRTLGLKLKKWKEQQLVSEAL